LRSATASPLLPSEAVSNIAFGGKNHDDQHDRLRFLMETIENS
jgi:hypothetical protein